MREKAIELRCDATVLEASFAMLPDRTETVEFRADAGERWRRHIQTACHSAQRYASDARDLAARLDRAAHDLETDQYAWGKAEDRYAAERRAASTQPHRAA
ncbi:MAG: hypothetical protein QOE11_2148 [Solirubrobacteraceae bacterium]|jgi:hypothetical protein|nr:hypothetical protein [Solirubrobacteraceae bacterium]